MPGGHVGKINWGGFFCTVFALGFALAGLLGNTGQNQNGELPIGQIQGREDVSPFLDRQVGFRGIVIGIREDQNSAGIRYYTFYVQSEDGASDGDPLTSDGIAVFTGRSRPRTKIGDLVEVWGVVTEFYGLTEIDDKGLHYQVISGDHLMPAPIVLDPPVEISGIGEYYEPYEGMLVKVPLAVTVGPTHIACGFSIVREDLGLNRILKRSQTDSRGDVIKVLYFSDVDCGNLPALATADRVEGIVGPLTYHFDQYKVVLQDSVILRTSKSDQPIVPLPRELFPGQFTIASFNLENYFDAIDDTGDSAEPKPSLLEINIKQTKLAHTIANTLACPTIIGVQEVEKFELLSELSVRLMEHCGFTYEVSHLDTADARGIDLGLLSNPQRVVIEQVSQFQICSQIESEIKDPSISCAEGEEPLFARQPFIVNLTVDGMPLTVMVNHFKSKRGGEEETEAWRIAQSQVLNQFIKRSQNDKSDQAMILLGDYNDFDQSPVRKALIESDMLVDALSSILAEERYSYIFDGESQLTDWVLITPNLTDIIIEARIAHVNADYPYQLKTATVPLLIAHRSSDHDIPVVTFDVAALDADPTNSVTQGQDTGETSDANIDPLPTTLKPIPPEIDTGKKNEGNILLFEEEAVDEIEETIIDTAGITADVVNQEDEYVDESIRLSNLGRILLAIVALCVLVIFVGVAVKKYSRR